MTEEMSTATEEQPTNSVAEGLSTRLKEFMAKLNMPTGPHPDAPPTPAVSCLKCKDTGWVGYRVPVGDPNFSKFFACECQKAGKLVTYGFSPEILKRKSFEPFRSRGDKSIEIALEKAQDYAKNPDGWLLFRGTTGNGKTHLAAAIANALVASGHTVNFSVVSKALTGLRATFSPNDPDSFDKKFAEEFCEVGVLILDDLGTEKPTEWAMETLYQIFNERYNNNLPTVITTNFDLVKYGQRGAYESRIADRLSDTEICAELVMLASSCRPLARNSLTQ